MIKKLTIGISYIQIRFYLLLFCFMILFPFKEDNQ